MGSRAQAESPTPEKSLSECRIYEIFFSLQGESTKIGLPTTFIRLSGCPLRCQYCDTTYAFHGGEKMSINNILEEVNQYQTRHITVTGGEPLAQRSCHELLSRLCDEGFHVSLETSGAIDISNVDKRVMKVVDIKTPGSAEEDKNKFENLEYLGKEDQLKFVICDHSDYEWSKQKLIELDLASYCEVLFSPEHESLSSTDLANWILEDRLNVRMQIQLHKYLWGNVPGK